VDAWLAAEHGTAPEASAEDLLLLSVHALAAMFLKENWTGKSYLFVNAEIWYQEERVFKSDPAMMKEYEEKLANIEFENLPEEYKLILKDLQITKEEFEKANFGVFKDPSFVKSCNPTIFAEHMVINGEDCYQTLKLLHFYLIARRVLDVH
jgi:hypothetical protein